MRVGFALRSAEIKPIVRQCVFDCWFVFFVFDDHLILIWQERERNDRRPHYPDLTNVQAIATLYSSSYTALYLHFFKSHDNECLQQHTNLPVCLSFFSTIGRTQTASCVLPAWSRPFLTHNMDLFFLLHILYSVWLLTTDIIVLCMFHHTYNQIKYCIVRGYLHGWCLCLRYMCVRRQYYIYGESDLLWMNIVFHVTVLL